MTAPATPERAATLHGTAMRGWAACAVLEDGSLWCWGANGSGQLGLGWRGAAWLSQAITDVARWSTIEAGWKLGCGLDRAGQAWCWGADASPFVSAMGSHVDAQRPVLVAPGVSDWTGLSGYSGHTCGIRADGSLWCWRANNTGQLGNGGTTQAYDPVPVQGAGPWSVVSAGNGHTCAVKADATLWCWGDGAHGRLGNGDTTARRSPVQVDLPPAWRTVSAGTSHACGLDAQGELWCWGRSSGGSLGVLGLGGDQTRPVAVRPGERWLTVRAGDLNTCAVREDNTSWCWGVNASGQVGDGSLVVKHEPSQVGVDAGWSDTQIATSHACGLRHGKLYCWGGNDWGQLGVRSHVIHPLPEPVRPDLDFTSFSVAERVSGAVDTTGQGWCWGFNGAGQLGDGLSWLRTPAEVPKP